MRIINLKNLKRECVLVELPDGHTLEDYVSETDEVGLPNKLGKFTDLKEEYFDGFVHRSVHYGDLYKSYNPKDVRPFSFAIESFISAIEAEGYTLTNQVGIYQAKNTSESEKLKQIDSQMVWQAAQKKVINLSNCYLFVKA